MNSIQSVSLAVLGQAYIGTSYFSDNNWAWLPDMIAEGATGPDLALAIIVFVMYAFIPALIWTGLFSIPFGKKGPLIATVALAAIVFFNPMAV